MEKQMKRFVHTLVRIGKGNKWLKYPVLLLFMAMVAVCEVCNAVKALAYPKMRRRMLAAVLTLCMVFSLLPMQAFAVEPAQVGFCEHHLAHTAECGYLEGTAEIPCTHEHTEYCFKETTNCTHEHIADCYDTDADIAAYSGAKEPVNCAHVCDEESGCITKASDCPHDRDEHNDTCGYVAGTAGTPCGYVCEVCNQTSELPDQDKIPTPEQGECICPPVDSGEVVHGEGCSLYVAPTVPEQQCICTALCAEGTSNADCAICAQEWAKCAYIALAPSEAMTAVLALIAALPTMEELEAVDTQVTEFADFLAKLRLDTAAARATYDALTDEEKAAFDADALAKLTALEAVLTAMPLPIYWQIGESVIPPATDAITITVNDDTAPHSGANLEAAVTASKLTTNTITTLKITAGEVTTEDWTYFAGGTPGSSKSPFITLETFEIDAAVNSVANIPDGAKSSKSMIFPTTITSVTIPQSIQIGKYAFYQCSMLAKAIIPNVTAVGEGTFYGCKKLTTISLPKVTMVHNSTFYLCESLQSIDAPILQTIGEKAFTATGFTEILLPQVKTIGTEAFSRCAALKKFTAPQLSTIVSKMFKDCSELAEVNTEAVETIGLSAFEN